MDGCKCAGDTLKAFIRYSGEPDVDDAPFLPSCCAIPVCF